MKNLFKIFFVFIALIAFSSCEKKRDKYILLGGGDTPTVLDTETNDIYVIELYRDGQTSIYKTNLKSAVTK